MNKLASPRIIISAAQRSSGKTTIAIGLGAALRERGLNIVPFKKGPDYIDPMWLSLAAGNQCHSLDFFIMGSDRIRAVFQSASRKADLSLIEGNMGFYDGMDISGQDSTSSLAKILKAPVILVIDTSKMTRGIAPLLLGYQQFESDNLISGVILNRVASLRHEEKLKAAISRYTGLKVLGSLPKLPEIEIKERHLGLTPIKEAPELTSVIEAISQVIQRYIDVDEVINLARSAPDLAKLKEDEPQLSPPLIKLGLAKDPAFTFYYPENLDALSRAGAEIIPFNTLIDTHLPQIDGLYLGGGFPEMFISKLNSNYTLRQDILSAIEQGLPVYAECGGLMYLSKAISYQGITRPMVGALNCEVRVYEKPQGHGYVVLKSTSHNHWFNFNSPIRGHEFHYSQMINPDRLNFAYQMLRGSGVNGRYDGIVYKNVLASYTHLHSSGLPEWAEQFVSFVKSAGWSF